MDKWLQRCANLPKKSTATETATANTCEEEMISDDYDEPSPVCSQQICENLPSTVTVNTHEEIISDDKSTPVRWQQIVKVGKQKCLKKRYNFCALWLKEDAFKGWLAASPNSKQQAVCKICNVIILAHKAVIKRHSKSERHKFNTTQINNNLKIPAMYKSNSLEINIKKAELKLCALLASNNLPFLLMDTLSPLLSNLFPDSEIARHLFCKRVKAKSIISKCLGKIFSNNLYKTLKKPGCFFSIIMDETTDISTKKQCAFNVIYYDDNKNCIVTRFFDLLELESGTANDLFNCLKQCITTKDIPSENFIGFASDTPNVMTGVHNSVFSLLKKEFQHIVCIKCSCHMIHLAASRACLKLPRSIEDLLRNIGSHFSRSSLRQTKFKEFQNFFKTELHKILTPCNTRWLSLKECVNRVLEQFEPLKAYFRQTLFDDPSITTENMVETMENKFTIAYMQFLSYVLNLLTEFNVLFQSAKPLIHKVKPETENLLKTLCSNYIDISEIKKTEILNVNHKNPNIFVPLHQIYLGIDAHGTIDLIKNNAKPQELDRFLQSILNFYIELVSCIKEKFDFKDKIYDIVSIVEPATAQSFKEKSLNYIIKAFPILNKFVDIQSLDNEWRQHAFLDFKCFNSSSAEIYWQQIWVLKNAADMPIFPNLKIVINYLMTLPFSNAAVERTFSDLFNIKNDKRNLLNTETVRAILFTKEGIKDCGGCVHFSPTEEMLHAKIW